MDFVSPEELHALAAKAAPTSPARHMVERAAFTIADLEARLQDCMAALQVARSAPEPAPVAAELDAMPVAELVTLPEIRAAIEAAVRDEVAAQLARSATPAGAAVTKAAVMDTAVMDTAVMAEIEVPTPVAPVVTTAPVAPAFVAAPAAEVAPAPEHSAVLADLLEASFAAPAAVAPVTARQPERIIDLTVPSPFAFPEFAAPPQS